MFNFLINKYNINNDSIIKISNKTYKIKTDDKSYIIKEVDDSLNKLYSSLSLLNFDVISLPLRGNNNLYVQEEDDKFYIVENYYSEEGKFNHEQKIPFFISFITKLHKKTITYIENSSMYQENILNYLDNRINKSSLEINARIEVIERKDYYSPNDYYFMMHYNIFSMALELASKHVNNLENAFKDEESLRVSLTYQNFDFDHILLKQQKIISLEKMAYTFISYDLYDLINNIKDSTFDINSYIASYIKENPLLEYEKEYLLCLLYSFTYYSFPSIKDDLTYLIRLVSYINKIVKLENEVLFKQEND